MAKQARPPVVAILGHVDHGKTTLLDAIRKTSVAAGEHGGITQHIGAYQAECQGKKITFLDTPGHAAFKHMRSRGAEATDIVVLVISAVEGVKPQTVESIQHIKEAGVPYIVALTKADLPEANPEMVKAQLTEHEVFVENYGGDIPVLLVSAKTGAGLDKLLEMILLVGELHELQGDAEAPLDAVVIESVRDKHRGTIATVLVHNGTLRKGMSIWAERVTAKVRSMNDSTGKSVSAAGPSFPVEVIGWDDVPAVGSQVTDVSPEAVTKEEQAKHFALPHALAVPTVEDSKPHLNIILKADTLGTLEAIISNLSAEIVLVSSGVGDVNEADVQLAEATKSRVIGFQVRISSQVKKTVEMSDVKIKLYTIIYELFEDLQQLVLKLLEPTIDEEELGVLSVLATFDMRGEHIAGGKVLSGEISKGKLYHVRRATVIIASPTRLKSLKRGKEDIEAAKTGTECGVVFRDFDQTQVGDEIVAYRLKDEL